MFTQLPMPVLLDLGGRAIEGALAAEYKQQPTDYRPIGSLVQKADDWFTLDAVYIVNKHMTLAAGYAQFGKMLNHWDNGVFIITTKW
jgi:hypothetical protein